MKRILPFVFAACLTGVYGQNYLMDYMFSPLNQNLLVNPAQKHNYRFVLGMPILSTVGINYQSSFVTPGEFLNNRPLSDNLDQVISNMKDANYLNISQSLDLMFVGFRIKKGYISFGVQQELYANLTLPGDLFKFLYYGNTGEYSSISIDNSTLNLDLFAGVNYHLGYQRTFLDNKLMLGARAKLIAGIGNAHFEKMNLQLNTDMFEWSIENDVLLEASTPIGDFEDPNLDLVEAISLLGRTNPGWAMDIGGTWTEEKWVFSASALNLGRVTWTNEVQRYQSQGRFVFEGFNYDFEGGNVNVQDVLDSLASAFEINKIDDASPYTTATPAHYLLGVQYLINDKHSFNLTYHGVNRQEKLLNNFGVNYIGNYIKRFNLIASGGYLNGGQLIFGFGLAAALGPFQLYVLSDNIRSYKIEDLNTVRIRFGLNLVFYNKTPKQKTKKNITEEKPLNN